MTPTKNIEKKEDVVKETGGRKREERKNEGDSTVNVKRAKREETPWIEENKKEKKEWMDENKKKRGTMGTGTQPRVIYKIITNRKKEGKEAFLIEWKNNERTWEPIENIHKGEANPALKVYREMQSTIKIKTIKTAKDEDPNEITVVKDMRRCKAHLEFFIAYADGSLIWTPLKHIPGGTCHEKIQIYADRNLMKYKAIMVEQLPTGFRISEEEFEEIEKERILKEEKQKKKASQKVMVKEEPKDDYEDDDIQIIDVIDRNVAGPAPPARRHLSSSPEL